MRWLEAQAAGYLGHLEEMGVYCLLDSSHSRLLAEVVCPQQAEVIVGVAVIQRQDEVYQCLPAAQAQQHPLSGTAGSNNHSQPSNLHGASSIWDAQAEA